MLGSEPARAKRQESNALERRNSKAAPVRSKRTEGETKLDRDTLWFQKSLDSSLCSGNCSLCDAEEKVDMTLETTPEEYADGLVILSNGVRIRKSVIISLSQTRSNSIGFVEGSQHVVNVTEWHFEIGDNTSKHLHHLLSELESIRNGFQRLKTIQHKNLFKYLAFTFRVGQKAVQVVVVKESCHCLPLTRMLARKYGNMSSSFLKMVSKNLLEGLHCLHKHGVVHGALDLTCLWESKNCFHMADFTVKRQLQLLQAEWNKPEGKLNLKERISLAIDDTEQRQSDLHSLGVCLCELACGRCLNGTVDEEVLSSLEPEFRDFISLLISAQEKERWPCRLLLMHRFLGGSTSVDFGDADQLGGNCAAASISLVDASCLANYALSKRMCEEFDVIRLVGKGGFGDVSEVRNKLDGCRYAIKRVPLVWKNNIVDAKILREVQLLSHLNHNNVVRYFNSWIETGVPHAEDESAPMSPLPLESNSLKGNDSFLEKLVPSFEVPSARQLSSEWERSSGESTEETSDSEDENSNYNSRADSGERVVSDSDSLVFEEESKAAKERQLASFQLDADLHYSSPVQRDDNFGKGVQILYIQMEMCEKSTLQTLIKSGELLVMPERGWRLFREVLEGLAYVHQKGFIHRDLKPSNIFIDCCDHAKIGDFGLAITGGAGKDVSSDPAFSLNVELSVENQWTSNVGTLLYAGPEATNSRRAVQITQKFDIYSLGIVLFEMFYRFKTAMERVTALTDLRKSEIVFPENFNWDPEFARQRTLLQQMLSHDVAKRPTAAELLESPYLPPMEINRAEFETSIRRSFSDRECSRYRFMVNAAFNQSDPPKDEYADYTGKREEFYGTRNLLARTVCEEKLVKIFRRYGAVRVDSALLVPRFLGIVGANEHRVDVMSSKGAIMHLPFDLRYPFARLLANNLNRLPYLKRYSIDRVYQQRFAGNCSEFLECAFDIVLPYKDRLVACAELLSVSSAIVDEFPEMDSYGYTVKLNHISLLQLILDANEIPKFATRSEVLEILSSSSSRRQKMERLKSALRSPALTSSLFMKLMFAEASPQEVGALCQEFLRLKRGNFAKADLYVRELEAICSFAEAAGNRLPIVVDLTVIPYNGEYNGVYFRIVGTRKMRKESAVAIETLAVGGQYEALVDRFQKLSHAEASLSGCAVGVSFAFDKIVRSMLSAASQEVSPLCDVMLCSIDSRTMTKEKLLLAGNLRVNGVSCEILHDSIISMETFLDECKALGISCVVVFKDNEYGYARLKTLEKEKFVDRKLTLEELFSCLTERFVSSPNGHLSGPVGMLGMKTSALGPSFVPTAKVDISYFLVEKSTSNSRRRFESHILKTLAGVLDMLAERKVVHVIATDMPCSVLQNFAAMMDVRDEVTYNSGLSLIAVNFTKYRKELIAAADFIKRLLFVEHCRLLILCSCYEEVYRIIAR